MRAHNVIIVSSGKVSYVQADAIDRLIHMIVSMKKQPILVLGPDGDDLLRTCSDIESCEIVFDPNFEGDLFSSVKAGLHTCSSATFVVHLGEETLSKSAWAELEKTLMNATENRTQVLRPASEAVKWPQLITTHGVQALKALPASTKWEDPQIVSQSIAVDDGPKDLNI